MNLNDTQQMLVLSSLDFTILLASAHC